MGFQNDAMGNQDFQRLSKRVNSEPLEASTSSTLYLLVVTRYLALTPSFLSDMVPSSVRVEYSGLSKEVTQNLSILVTSIRLNFEHQK